jgi:hypothetical protein
MVEKFPKLMRRRHFESMGIDRGVFLRKEVF